MQAKKIIIVDDDIDIIVALEVVLKKEGFIVISANDKIEGKKLILEEKPDLAIIDVMMRTHYEGFELAKDIIEDSVMKNTKVLMQTSIDILTTTKTSVQEKAREYRKDPNCKNLQVLLVKNVTSGAAGVDYKSEDGKTIWFPVDGFIRKPVDAKTLLPAVKRILEL